MAAWLRVAKTNRPVRLSHLIQSWGVDAQLRVNAFRNRTQLTRSITSVTGNGLCLDLRIATLETTNRW